MYTQDYLLRLLEQLAQALARLTPESAALLLAKGAKVRIYASLLQAEADVLSARGATDLARSLLSEVDRAALDGATLNDLRALVMVR